MYNRKNYKCLDVVYFGLFLKNKCCHYDRVVDGGVRWGVKHELECTHTLPIYLDVTNIPRKIYMQVMFPSSKVTSERRRLRTAGLHCDSAHILLTEGGARRGVGGTRKARPWCRHPAAMQQSRSSSRGARVVQPQPHQAG